MTTEEQQDLKEQVSKNQERMPHSGASAATVVAGRLAANEELDMRAFGVGMSSSVKEVNGVHNGTKAPQEEEPGASSVRKADEPGRGESVDDANRRKEGLFNTLKPCDEASARRADEPGGGESASADRQSAGLIKTLKGAGLDTKGEITAPTAHWQKNRRAVDEGGHHPSDLPKP